MQYAASFIDPTIPGLSVRDTAPHAIDTVDPDSLGRGPGRRHRAFQTLRGLARLDAETLRDIGVLREAA